MTVSLKGDPCSAPAPLSGLAAEGDLGVGGRAVGRRGRTDEGTASATHERTRTKPSKEEEDDDDEERDTFTNSEPAGASRLLLQLPL